MDSNWRKSETKVFQVKKSIMKSTLNRCLFSARKFNYEFFSEILQSCKNNEPLIEALNLNEKEFDLPTHFERFQRQINESLEEFDFSNESITKIESFSSQIQQYESNLTELSTKFDQVKQLFANEQTLTNYENEINETEKILEKLEKSMENVSSTLEILPEKLQKLLNFKSKFQDFILDFPQKIKDGIKGSINCDSILEIRQSVEDLICGNILDGINGSWSGLGLVLIIVIPIMIISNYLDSAMRKSSQTDDDNDFTDFMANPSQHIYMNGNFYFLNFAQLNFVCFRIEPKCPKPKQFAIQSNNIKYLGLKMTFQFDLQS